MKQELLNKTLINTILANNYGGCISCTKIILDIYVMLSMINLL